MKANLPEPPPMGFDNAAGVLVDSARGVLAVDVETGVKVNAGVRVDVGANVCVAAGLAGASEPHADEIKISAIRVQVTFDCFLIAPYFFQIPQPYQVIEVLFLPCMYN